MLFRMAQLVFLADSDYGLLCASARLNIIDLILMQTLQIVVGGH